MFKLSILQPQTIVICVSEEKLLASVWQRQRLKTFVQFSLNQQNDQAFAAWLEDYPTANVYVIVNTFEEDYRVERLPKLMGFEKRDLVQRKLNQVYRNLNYKTAQLLGKDNQQRNEDCYLFSALGSDACLQPWLSILHNAERSIVGVYLLSMLSPYLLRATANKNSAILLCEYLSSGIRHSFIRAGKTHMSRLMPDVSITHQDADAFYVSEIEKTRSYLINRRLISADSTLDCLLLNFGVLTQKITERLEAHAAEFKILNTAHSDTTPPPRLGVIAQNIVAKTPELLHMHALACGAKIPNLAPEKISRNFHIRRMRYYLNGISALCLFFGLILSVLRYQQGLDQQSLASHYQHLSSVAAERNQQLVQQFPLKNLDLTHLERTLQLNKLLSVYPESPIHVMQILSQALEATENAELNKINLTRMQWNVVTDMLHSADADSIAVSAAIDEAAEITIVSGEIHDTQGDPRVIDQYVANLRKHPDVAEVSLLELPTANKISDTFNAQTSEKPSQLLQFKLKLLLKPFYTQEHKA